MKCAAKRAATKQEIFEDLSAAYLPWTDAQTVF
jgi:hypothetical protein